MPDINREMVERNKKTLLDLGTAVGSWTTKADLRQTGLSVHIKFERSVPIATTQLFLGVIENSPGMLVNALRLLLGEEQVFEDA